MNSQSNQHFFDLAMKELTQKATASERAEFEALLTREPGLRAEFERLRTDLRVGKAVLPLVEAADAATGELPAYARERLQTKVRETFGCPERSQTSSPWSWRWILGLASALAVVVAVSLVGILRQHQGPVVQVAMLDLAGPTRGSDSADMDALRRTWEGAPVESLTTLSDLRTWETDWPDDTGRLVVKVIFDRSAGEIRLLKRDGAVLVEQVFPVEGNLRDTLERVRTALD